MKKIVILLFVACALFTFSCNKYCHCKLYVGDEKGENFELDKSYKGEFVKESNLACADYSTEPRLIDGKTYKTNCK